MGDVVNLRQVRKQKARTEKERLAGESRALHGRSKAERDRDRLAADKAEHFIAGHRREKPGDPNES
ncbi:MULTISPECIES: DUF4169 family protein [Mesorhizobium]|uniref:DUF4169 family protein n=1 Tax=Mesorhizobium abyssinicae TaxID=1209958 RepID=A0ABU5ALU9_9HYPH|nr:MULTISPECIES: DUF4169 family protein [Mesorhizobium]MDX8538256.1 DUF4169 family protein [Mesorhizobium abyssinicae]RVD28269.1 DUF4169 family protein [Mesorhizobium sp. M4B.F.Ca.ET.017.02.2.1]